MIKQTLITQFPLAFRAKGDDSPSCAMVPPVQISVDQDAKVVNRKTAIKLPIRMEEPCNELISKLLAQDKIARVDHCTTWCSPARFVRKSSGAPRLVVNFKGLNKAGE